MSKFQSPKKGSMEYLLKDLSRSKKAELRRLALEGALAKMTEEEQKTIEDLALRISLPIKGLGRIGALGFLAAATIALSD